MIKYVFLLFCATLFATSLEVNALKCWVCSSELGSPNCQDPFNPSTFTEIQKESSYRECTSPRKDEPTSCKKIAIQINDDPVIIVRSCTWDQDDSCAGDIAASPSFAKIKFCQTCKTDGCNGEAMN